MHGWQYDMPPLPDGGMWIQSTWESKNLTAIKADEKIENEKPKAIVAIWESIDSQEGISMPISKETKDKVISNKGSDIETDQAEKLDVPLTRSQKC